MRAVDEAFLQTHSSGLFMGHASTEALDRQPHSGATIQITFHKATAEMPCGILLRSYNIPGSTSLSTRVAGLSGPASDAGLKVGMRLLKVNGTKITGANMACELMKAATGDVTLFVSAPPAHVPGCLKSTSFLWLMCILISLNYGVLVIAASLRLPSLIFGHLLLGLFFTSLYQTMVTHPGLVHEDWMTEQALADEESSLHGGVLPEFVPHFLCKRSQRRLPPRAAYVSITGEAYLLFDHYCKWIATPIGLRNRRFFLQFITYGTTLCVFGAVCTGSAAHSHPNITTHDVIGRWSRILLALLDLGVGLLLGHFSAGNWFLAIKNSTIVADRFDPNVAKYDLGSWTLNLEASIFGPRPICMWVLPRRKGGPLTDGFNWQSGKDEPANMKSV